jgi:hypothetical protein
MSILDFDLIKAQGGSIRVYIGHSNKKNKKNKISRQIKLEKKIGLLTEDIYKKFYNRINNHRKKIRKFINSKIIKQNKILVGYGAPAKATTFSYFFDLGKNSIKYIFDDNPLKQNKYTPGKKIKICTCTQLQQTSRRRRTTKEKEM